VCACISALYVQDHREVLVLILPLHHFFIISFFPLPFFSCRRTEIKGVLWPPPSPFFLVRFCAGAFLLSFAAASGVSIIPLMCGAHTVQRTPRRKECRRRVTEKIHVACFPLRTSRVKRGSRLATRKKKKYGCSKRAIYAARSPQNKRMNGRCASSTCVFYSSLITFLFQ
jgi:hypothetical protein